MFALQRKEWVAVAVVVAMIVAINKLLVHDTRNTWAGLLLLAFWLGLGLVHLARRLRRTT